LYQDNSEQIGNIDATTNSPATAAKTHVMANPILSPAFGGIQKQANAAKFNNILIKTTDRTYGADARSNFKVYIITGQSSSGQPIQ
jgi:hypothetical protein